MFHRWIGEDENIVRCLTCGGIWQHVRDRVYREDVYLSFDGRVPTECLGSTDACHHYENECPRTDEECTRQECNCLSCFS